MKTNKLLIVFALLCLFGVDTVLACDCAGKPLTEEVKSKAAVFSGKVIAQEYESITDISDTDFGAYVLTIKLKVDRWWKGNGNNEVVLRTRIIRKGWVRRDSCDYFFRLDESYLVFANVYNQDWLQTSACTRTKMLSNAKEDLEKLGEGFKPQDNSGILETIPELNTN